MTQYYLLICLKYFMYVGYLQLCYIIFIMTNYSLFLTTKLIIALCSSNGCLFYNRMIWKWSITCTCVYSWLVCVVTQWHFENVCHKVNNTDLLDGTENILKHNCQKQGSKYTDFAFRFYKQAISKEDDKNIFFSPISISIAFATLAVGSKATTLIQVSHTWYTWKFS